MSSFSKRALRSDWSANSRPRPSTTNYMQSYHELSISHLFFPRFGQIVCFNSEFSLALDVIYFSLWLDEVVTLGFNLTRHLIENFLTGTIEKRFSTFLFIVLQRITFRYFFF